MKAKVARYLFAVWFALLLTLGNTPMDFIHQFADHTDTIHKKHNGLVIEKKHHHCAYLSLTLAAFISDYSVPFTIYGYKEFFVRHSAIATNYVQRSIIAVSLRGPPVA